MHATDFIAAKRDRQHHHAEDIHRWFQMIASGDVTDDQIAAWLMAVYLNGLHEDELYAVTEGMIHSGDVIDLSRIQGIIVDKHSTGGVADTTTLVTGPIVSALGIPFAKMSGRGLGHTGGTLDKLSSIPGIRTDLTEDEFVDQVNRIQIAVTGQTGTLVPADGKLYALRDVTATIDSIPLIASSIMSKKLAVGADKIVLDVKVGSGAFMQDVKKATALAQTMAKIGRYFGKETVCLITDMDEPLGDYIGNALEVYEALEILHGKRTGRLLDVSLALAVQEILLAEVTDDASIAENMTVQTIQTGAALEHFVQMVQSQGGDPSYLHEPSKLMKASKAYEVIAKTGGTITHIHARGIGEAALELGCGRLKKTDIIDLYAGIHLQKRSGTQVNKGDVLAVLYSDQPERAELAGEIVAQNIQIGSTAKRRPLVFARVTADDIQEFEE